MEGGPAPEVLLADTAYDSGENLAACADLCVALLASVPGRLVEPPPGGLGDFGAATEN